jgi:tight adherence protein B
MLEEIRLQTGSLGRSVPQALFTVGRRGPADFRSAFAAAEREWLLTTDFARTVALLKERLADPTADVTLETLLVAHEVGGSELDRRLAALIEDRVEDLQGRKDARAKQSGVRFARRFVLIVPIGMAFAGLSIGTGRSAYQTPMGQLAVVGGIAVMGGCWLWAGRLMRLPEEDRVFAGRLS